MPAPRSRIPRSNGASAAVANENAPPAQTERARSATKLHPPLPHAVRVSAVPLAPAASKRAVTARTLVKSTSATTLVIRQPSAPAPPPVTEIAIQHPSCDPADTPDSLDLARRASKTSFDDERDDAEEAPQQMPTPPTSQSPPNDAVLMDHDKQPDASHLAPPQRDYNPPRSRSLSALPSTSRPTARRASHSPAVPDSTAGPPRASAAPAPCRRGTASSLLPLPAPSATATAPKSTATGRRKGKKLRPRPSETLPEPLELGSSDDGDDPLLLVGSVEPVHPPARARVWGAGGRREVRWSALPLFVAAEGARGGSVKPEETSVEEVHNEDLGQAREGGDAESGAPWHDGDEPVQAYQPLAFGAAAAHLDPSDLGGDDTHYDYPAFEHDESPISNPGNGAAGDGIGLGLGELALSARASAEPNEEHDSDGGFAPLQEASSAAGSDVDNEASEPEEPAALGVPTMRRTRPSYPPLSPNRTGEWDSTVPVALDSSPARALREPTPRARGARPSYPPLSPNTTGEFDAEVPLRLDSSPVRGGTGAGMPTESSEEDVDVEASRGWSAREWRVKVETHDELVVAVAPAPVASTPVSCGSRTTISTPANLLYSAIRSPSPALSPRPLLPPSSAARASRSPQPQLAFASPRVARDRLTHLVPPSPAAPAPAPPSPKAWTRGPAFFRSSSFSPPAHAELPRSATLFERRPGRVGEEGQEEEERSREYFRFADLTATSPMPEEVARAEEERSADEDEEEDQAGEVVLVGQEAQALERARTQSRSLSPTQEAEAEEEAHHPAPPTPAKDRLAHVEDERMASPGVSPSGSASPARSAYGDVQMSSPSPRNSPSFDRGAKKLPSTPGAQRAADEDVRMMSPSPARQGSPLKARIGEFVDEGRTKLQGLLFGPRASTPTGTEQLSAEREGGPPEEEVVEEEEEREDREEDDDNEPFPQPKQHPRPPASHADSTFNTSRSHASFASSTSHRPRRRSRPSHPALPVIEITSTDARAAARAAAILKVHHKYVEQGISAVDAARIVQAEVAAGEVAAEEEEDEGSEEEELRTLLLDAEDELREQLPAPRARSETDSETPPAPPASVSASGSSSVAAERWTSNEWRRLEQTLVELGRRNRRGTSVSSAASASMSMASEAIALASVTGEDVEPEKVVEAFLRKWGFGREGCVGEWAWDKLIVRVDALKARRAKDARQRRTSSVSTGVSHAASRLDKAPLVLPQTLAEEVERAPSAESAGTDVGEQESTPEPAVAIKQEPLSDDEASPAVAADGSDSEYSDEDGHLADDTFFALSTRDRRTRRTSVEPVYVPTALANPRLRHLYDEFQPEKPKLPLKDYLRDDSPSSDSGEEVIEEGDTLASSAPRESTPDAAGGAAEPPKSPSSAQRIFSYLGSFVRPSPAPSPASSTRALPADSDSDSPSPAPDMQQVQLSASLVTPHFASTAKPFPPLPTAALHKPLPHVHDREIRPLPHLGAVHRADASTSRVTLDGDADLSGSSGTSSHSHSFSRRRRRSSGDGVSGTGRVWAAVDAIEEAESSREEEESRVIELLQTGSAKRRATSGDLRSALGQDGGVKGKGKAREVDGHWRGFVEIDQGLGRTMIPTGTRALDRVVSGERRASRR